MAYLQKLFAAIVML